MRARAAALCAAAALAGCAAHGGAPAASPSATPSGAAARPRTEYYIHGSGAGGRQVKVEDSVKGRPLYVLKAADVYYSTSSSKGRFLHDTIVFYQGSAVRLTVVAPVADVDRTTYDFVLHDRVHAKSALGVTLDCDELAYNGIAQTLTATGNVRAVDAQGDVVTGDKAVADLDLQQIHMSGHVGIGR